MRLVKESLVFRLYLRFLEFLKKSADGSMFFSGFLKGCRNSSILKTRFFSRASELWVESKIHVFFCAVLNLPFTAARALWRVSPQKLSESALLSVAKPKYMPALFGVCIGVLFLIPHKYFNNQYSLFVMAALFLVFLLCVLTGHYSNFRIKHIGFFYLFFGVMVLFSFLRDTDSGFRPLMFYFTALLALLLIQGVINSRKALYTFICILLAAITISGLYGIYQSVVGVPVVSSQVDFYVNTDMPGRVYSSFENPNNFAEILVMTIPLYFAMFYTAKTNKQKLIIFLCALPPILAILLTLSRSGWGALAVAMVIFFLFSHRSVLPAMVIAGVCALPVIPSFLVNRLLTVFQGGDSSTQFRQTIRETLVPVLEKHWLLGTGLGTDSVRAAIREEYTTTELPTWAILAHAHNVFLQILAEMGIFGLLAVAALLLTFFASCIKGIIKNPRDRFIIAAGAGSIVGMLIAGTVEYIWFYPRVMLMFWLTIGIALAAVRVGRDEAQGT